MSREQHQLSGRSVGCVVHMRIEFPFYEISVLIFLLMLNMQPTQSPEKNLKLPKEEDSGNLKLLELKKDTSYSSKVDPLWPKSHLIFKMCCSHQSRNLRHPFRKIIFSLLSRNKIILTEVTSALLIIEALTLFKECTICFIFLRHRSVHCFIFLLNIHSGIRSHKMIWGWDLFCLF